jgi:hypothetical protein
MEINNELEKALQLIEENKTKRLQEFQEKLLNLCKEYNVTIDTQIILKAN